MNTDDLIWRQSSFSGGGNSNCIEVAEAGELIAMRNSNHPDRGILLFTRAEIDAFLKGAKAGEFDELS